MKFYAVSMLIACYHILDTTACFVYGLHSDRSFEKSIFQIQIVTRVHTELSSLVLMCLAKCAVFRCQPKPHTGPVSHCAGSLSQLRESETERESMLQFTMIVGVVCLSY